MTSSPARQPGPPAPGGGAAREIPPGPILVATAGRGNAAEIAMARLLGERSGRIPEVIAVHDPAVMYLPGVGMEPLLPELESDRRRQLGGAVIDALRADHGNEPPWPVRIVAGRPPRAIARAARDGRARMIVMGLGRHAPVDRFLGSETALMTVREADRPVLAVASDFAGLPRHAVVAMDFSAASVVAAREALALLADGGRLSLVHVRPPADSFLLTGVDPRGATLGRRVTELFQRLVAALAPPPSVTVATVVLDGDPGEELLRFAERERADLIATGSSGMGFLERLIVGSVATRIIRHSAVSVLVVPRPSAAEVERVEEMLADTVQTPEAARWPALLEGFTERNAGRPTRLEVDDPALGAQLQQTGYTLLGASYDRRDGRLELMLGSSVAGGAHLTHTIHDLASVAVLTDPRQRDVALQARHGDGQTILTFTD